MTKLKIKIENIIFIAECFVYYFTYIFFTNINRVLSTYNSHLFFPPEKKVDKEKEENENDNKNILPFESLSLNINQIIINLSTTNHTEISLNKETILFQLNKLNFYLDNSLIGFGIEEILLGCIQNNTFYDFYFDKNNLVFQTTIFNLFDINQEISFDNFKNNKTKIPLNSIIIEITKKDIDNLYIFYASFDSLSKLMTKFENNDNKVIMENSLYKAPTISSGFTTRNHRLRLNSYQYDDTNFLFKNLLVTKDKDKKFCLFIIDKIIVYIRLDKYSKYEQNNPEKMEFKHIIIIMNRINFAAMESKNDISIFFSFDSIHIFHKNQFLFKFLESKT